MKKKAKKAGGVRANSGRKKVDDPKIPITIYVEQSKVESVGKDHLRTEMVSKANELAENS